jgi:c-di-GMP-binding flagellar brake protein YcgR
MACRFYQQADFSLKTGFDKIQLKLRGRLVMVSGIVAGKRENEGEQVYVVLFTSYVSQDARKRLSSFIYNTLQTEMRKELESV